MGNFEIIYREMERLLILELPEVIRNLNEEKNDGLIIPSFANKTLQDKNIQTPCFNFSIAQAEKTEKEILIENIVFKCVVEIHLNENEKDWQIKLWRYFESVDRLMEENEMSDFWQSARVSGADGNRIIIRVVV